MTGMTQGPAQRGWVYPAALAIALTILAAAIYAGVASHELLNYDDNIDLNPGLAELQEGLSPHGIHWALTSTFHANWLPVTRLTWLLDISLFGFSPRVFLLGNVFYHALATLLLFVALRRLTGATHRSALVAAIFAVHPLHVESVAWATERKDVVFGACWMATMVAYAGYGRRPNPLRYLFVLGWGALALLAKPMAVTLPLALLLLDGWPLGRIRMASLAAAVRSVGWPLAEKLPLVALAVVTSVITIRAQYAGGAMQDLGLVPLPARLANAAISYWTYIGQFFWPADLVVFYPHPGESVSTAGAAVAALALAAVTLLALRSAPRRPYVTIGWLWYLLTLVPVIGIVQAGYQGHADRYMYVPIVGLSLIVVWGGAELAERLRVPAALRAALAGAVLVALTAGAVTQVGHWRSSETLFRHALEVNPKNWQAHQNLAALAVTKRDIEAAEEHWARALAERPVWPSGYIAHAGILIRLGRVDEGLAALRKAVDLDPALVPLRAIQLHQLAASGDPEKAVLATREELYRAENPAEVRVRHAHALLDAGRPEEALGALRQALEAEPGLPEIHGALGGILVQLGRAEEAETSLREAVRRDPSSATLHAEHAAVLEKLGRSGEAVAAYEAALALEEDPAPAIENNLALLLATSADPAVRNPAEAIRLAESAVEHLDREDAGSLDTLAAAYASAGRMDEALSTAADALAAAEASGDPAAIDAVRTRLAALSGGISGAARGVE